MPRCPTQKLLHGQKALVTGASSGIGRAIAVALGEAGADVVVNYVAGESRRARSSCEDPARRQPRVRAPADVSSEDEVEAMFRRMIDEFGTIDILVNNAGLQQDAPFERADAGAVEQGDRREPDRPVPVRARGGPRVQAARRAAGDLLRAPARSSASARSTR